MSIDTIPAPAPAQQVNGHAETNGVDGQEGVDQVQNGIAAMKLEAQQQQQQEQQQPQQQQQQQQQSVEDNQGQGQDVELHRACAGGNVEEVRSVLSRGLENLEVLDMNTGCTPIVLAIRNGHVEVVRELLSAGAIVPPPGLTADPTMLALLYPQSMYPLPPHASYGRMPPPPEFFPQNGFYPNQHANAPGQERYPPFGRKESVSNGSLANLPPAEVSKTIPCRNFPNCKYGAGCVFFHPQGPAGPGPFYPPGRMSFGGPGGFEGGFQPGFQGQPYFVPNGFQSFPPPPTEGGAIPSPVQGDNAEQSGAENSDLSASTETVSSQPPSAVAPIFVPQHGFAPGPQHIGSPGAPSQFGLSPLSPSMLAGSLPSIPPAEAFFAGSPPNMPAYHPNGFPDPRRQSFGQPFANGPNGPKFHGKKPSFSGGPRPFRPPGNLGAWKDGVPPPCAFFVQGKCRNGEFCKFPHMDESGNDVRHPDVIRGLIAPVPSMRQSVRGRMSGGFGYDPSFRPQQHGQQNGAMPNGVHGQGIPEGESVAQTNEATPAESNDAAEAANGTTAEDKPVLPASVPQKPVAATTGNGADNSSPIVRSASQPGVQRVHANGLTSRSHSPAPSNVSFHGNGHPRRAGGVRAPYNGTRSSSTGESRLAQRVPGADDFPALGGMGGSVNTSPRPDAEKWDGKTAAQVLSAPAPVKAKATTEESESGVEASAGTEVTDADAQSIKSDASVSMEDESDSDAVIISHKPSPAPTPSAATTAAAKKSSVSFAKVISAAAAVTGTASAPEATTAAAVAA